MIQLTNGQQKASDAFFNFLFSEAITFVLSGGAGVGKTYLMGHLSNEIMQTYQNSCRLLGLEPDYDTVIFTATTNKAAEVLEKAINKPVSTIHSFLGLKVHEDTRTGLQMLQKTGSWRRRDKHILFIDESSMIDTELYDLIMDSFTDSKIIFVGDHAQMAPITEAVSPVYKNVDQDNFVFLDEPVRNAHSPALIALCTQLRDIVETGVFSPIASMPGVVDFLSKPEMQKELDVFFKEPEPNGRILCYTNTRVQDYNAYIRELRGLPPEIIVGDLLVVARAYLSGKTTLSVEREVEVLSIQPTVHDAGYEWLFADKLPILYRIAIVKDFSSQSIEHEVKIPTDPERVSLALKALAKQKSWGPYYELKSMFIDLRDKDACTVYKSQGSTYETVFIDLGNIGTSFKPEQVARMLFVAASRASKRVCFFGQLPNRYIGG